jgi:hypothetical protein
VWFPELILLSLELLMLVGTLVPTAQIGIRFQYPLIPRLEHLRPHGGKMPVTVTIRLIELEPSAGAYDGSKIESSGSGGYVEVNQTYSEVTITDGITLTAVDPTGDYKKRLLQFIFGVPAPTAQILGKEIR